MLPYPFGGEGLSSGYCGCQYHCYPQFRATAQSVHLERTKYGSSDYHFYWTTPPKRFLQRRADWSVYTPGSGVAHYWTRTTIDPVTGAETVEESDPPPPESLPSFSEGELIVDQPTIRRYVHTSMSGIVYESLKTLNDENTTEQLIYGVIDDLPAFEDPFAMTLDPYTAESVLTGACYSGGIPWDEASRYQIPNYWALSTNELTFALQRVRYRIDFNFSLLPGNYELEWDEVFVPSTGSPSVLASPSFTGTETDSETDVRTLTEQQANGRVWITNVRFTSLT